jgi:F-type H+-transporting ATPase subunit epsilon
MAKKFNFEVVTPDRLFFAQEVEAISFSTPEGEMGVLADHTPMLIATIPCVLKISYDATEEFATIGEGFFEITKEKVVAIVDSAEWPEEIDVIRAKAAKERAEEQLKSQKVDYEMEQLLKMSIERANNRIKTAKR